MPKQQKCSSCSSGRCSNHVFELKPMISHLYFGKIQKTRLCPRLNKTTKQFQVSIPLLNRDRKYYTPSFILEEERSFYFENDKKMLKSHEQKVEEMGEGSTQQIWVAKHGRKRKYCTVCHIEYEDYLTHIFDISHKEKINKSRYTHFIKEMAAEFSRRRVRRVRDIKKTDQTIDDTADPIENNLEKPTHQQQFQEQQIQGSGLEKCVTIEVDKEKQFSFI